MKVNIPVEKSIFGQKARLDILAGESIEKIIDFAKIVNSSTAAEEIESRENELEEYYYGIINSFEKCILPFWWEDFFSIETELKSLVSQLVIFTNKIKFIKNRTPFDLLLKREILILEKVKKYFSDIIPAPAEGRKAFAGEIASEIRELNRTFIETLKNVRQQSDENRSMMVFDIFERTNQINNRIVDSINRINLGAAV